MVAAYPTKNSRPVLNHERDAHSSHDSLSDLGRFDSLSWVDPLESNPNTSAMTLNPQQAQWHERLYYLRSMGSSVQKDASVDMAIALENLSQAYQEFKQTPNEVLNTLLTQKPTEVDQVKDNVKKIVGGYLCLLRDGDFNNSVMHSVIAICQHMDKLGLTENEQEVLWETSYNTMKIQAEFGSQFTKDDIQDALHRNNAKLGLSKRLAFNAWSINMEVLFRWQGANRDLSSLNIESKSSYTNLLGQMIRTLDSYQSRISKRDGWMRQKAFEELSPSETQFLLRSFELLKVASMQLDKHAEIKEGLRGILAMSSQNGFEEGLNGRWKTLQANARKQQELQKAPMSSGGQSEEFSVGSAALSQEEGLAVSGLQKISETVEDRNAQAALNLKGSHPEMPPSEQNLTELSNHQPVIRRR